MFLLPVPRLRSGAFLFCCLALVGGTAAFAAPATAGDGPYHYAVATALMGEGELEAAAEAFEQVLAADPEAAYPRIEYAELLLRLDRVPAALTRSEEALQLAPRDPDVLRGYGQIQLAVARRDRDAVARATRALEKLREIDPSDLAGMVTLGQIYLSLERPADAVDVFQQLVNHHTDHRQLKRLLVDALTAAGEEERAREVLEELVRLDQESLENRIALAQLESDRGNHGAAIDILESSDPEYRQSPQLLVALSQEYALRSQSPGLSERQRESDLDRSLEILDGLLREDYQFGLVARRARVLALRGDLAGAEAALREAWQRLPGDARAPLQLARVLEGAGKEDEAATILRGLLDSEGRSNGALAVEVRQRLAALEARRGNWKDVLGHTQALLAQIETAESRVEVVALQAEALVQLRRPEKALDLLEKEEERFGPDPRLLLGRADLLSELDRNEEAFAVLARPELAAATEDELFYGRVRALLSLDAVEAAVAALRERADAGGADALLRAGQFLTFHERFEEAVAFLRDAVAASAGRSADERADTHFYLGQALERTGRFGEAAEQFERVLDLRKDDSTALNYLGYMWADQGLNLDKALALVQRAVELQPTNGAYVDSLGWAQYRLGRLDEARASLERAAELMPENATIHEHLGDVYLASGDAARARVAYERAVQLDDDDVEKVREKLARLLAGQL